MGELSPIHWAIVAVVVLVLFGSKKLPDAARSLGKSMRIMKTEIKGLHDDDEATPATTTTTETLPAATVVVAPVSSVADPVPADAPTTAPE
jgi:sec-independent protein translocase protein TatA